MLEFDPLHAADKKEMKSNTDSIRYQGSLDIGIVQFAICLGYGDKSRQRRRSSVNLDYYH